MTSIGNYAFHNIIQLNNVVIPSSVKTIGNMTFDHTRLTEVMIPNGVEKIGYSAFEGSGLINVYLSETVSEIGSASFNKCGLLKRITIMNPNLKIPLYPTTISNNYYMGYADDGSMYYKFVFNGDIYGYYNSTAQEYAENCAYTFVPLDSYYSEPVMVQTTSMATTTTTTSATSTTTTTTAVMLELNATSITLTNGEQFQITANRNNLTYKSNNTKVAVVSPNGIITAIGIGHAIISVIDSDYNVSQIAVDVVAVTTTTTTVTTSTITTTETSTETTTTTEATTTTPKADSRVVGSWYLYSIECYPNSTTYYDEDQTILIFKDDFTYELYSKGTSSYTVTSGTWSSDGNTVTFGNNAELGLTGTNANMLRRSVWSTTGWIYYTYMRGGIISDFTTTEPFPDIDGDGEITARDAQKVLTAFAEILSGNPSGLTPEQEAAADVTGDHEITAMDAQYILTYFLYNTVLEDPITWDELLRPNDE